MSEEEKLAGRSAVDKVRTKGDVCRASGTCANIAGVALGGETVSVPP